MKEYIERELLLIGVDGCISALHAKAKGDPIQEYAIKLVESTRNYITSIPAADVAEVRRGRWEHTHTSDSYFVECWRCSECGFDDTEGFCFDYCPSCGARMDKEDEHEAD